jgi:plastocyanin
MLCAMKMSRLAVPTLFLLAFGAACSSGGGSTTTTPPAQTTTSTATSPSASAPASNAVTITMTDFKFNPSTVSASTSQDIILVNNGAALHNFSIDGTAISVDVPPGQTMTLTAPGPSFPAGAHPFFCKYHKSLGMTGTLTATTG